MNPELENKDLEKVYLITPLWHLLFFVMGAFILILIGISVRLITGLSSSDDRVFAVEALVTGLLTEIVIKKWFHKELYLFPKLNLRFYYFWIFLSFYVFIFQPFEQI